MPDENQEQTNETTESQPERENTANIPPPEDTELSEVAKAQNVIEMVVAPDEQLPTGGITDVVETAPAGEGPPSPEGSSGEGAGDPAPPASSSPEE